jgi:hypothetical protein
MANVAAYSGLRWGEIAALTIAQVGQAARVITVDRKVVEVGGRLYVEAPKNRKFRRTIYPRRTPGGYPLADRLAARIEEALAEQEGGSNPLGLVFPKRRGGYWRSSNFNRRVLQPAYLEAGWRDADGVRLPVLAARAGAQGVDAPGGLERSSRVFGGFLDQPGDHEELADLAEDRVAQPLHDVVAVDAGEVLVLLAGVPAIFERSQLFDQEGAVVRVSQAVASMREAALANGSSGGRSTSAGAVR